MCESMNSPLRRSQRDQGYADNNEHSRPDQFSVRDETPERLLAC